MTDAEAASVKVKPKGAPGPFLGTIWWTLTLIIVASVAGAGIEESGLKIKIGTRSLLALVGYLVMQIGLWMAEDKWDEMGSKAFLEEAKKGNEAVSEGMN